MGAVTRFVQEIEYRPIVEQETRYANRTRHRQCSRPHSHRMDFGQVGPGLGEVPEPRRFSRVLDGVDPVDGGDARRSLILRSDGKYALAARDTMLTSATAPIAVLPASTMARSSVEL